MRRRRFLATLGTAGAVGTAGCGAVGSETTLSDPTVHRDSNRRRSLRFASDGEEVGSLGVTGTASGDVIDLDTELWHRSGTEVASIRLGVWADQEGTDAPGEVALVSPVEGDSSPPPSVSLYSPRRSRGTVVEITDLDDLADETISTIGLLVRPRSQAAATVVVDAVIELTSSGWFDSGYTLDGRLQLEFPEFGGE